MRNEKYKMEMENVFLKSIRTMATLKVTSGSVTDKGLNPKRLENEDNLLALPKRGLFLVADGVGGRRGGQVASQTVVDVFRKVFTQEQPDDLSDLVLNTIDFCNQKIYEESASNPELGGMATTIALLSVKDKRAVIAHVGDSRVYRYNHRGLVCLTQDHSEAYEALRAGMITEDQVATYPRRNVINRALGAEPDVQPDLLEIEIDENTSFMLCSDGINRHVTDEEIERLMRSQRRPEAVCEALKELCYKGGAEDNLTALVVDFGERIYLDEPTRPIPAARAKVAPASSTLDSRSRRIEVDLKTSEPARKSVADSQSSSVYPRSDSDADNNKSKLFQLPHHFSQAAAENSETNAPEKAEWSKFMKISTLITMLVAGIVIGTILAGPVGRGLDGLFGDGKILSRAGVKYPPADPEVSSAYARFFEGQTEEARRRLNKVLSEHPNNAEAYFYLGRIDYAENKLDEAISNMSQALKLDPNLPDIRVHLAMAYLAIGQGRNARDILQQVIEPAREASPTPSPSSATVSSTPAI
jgi:serine/threonine protein phosphatase PrpC/cytochrome c-type biogenesis protein CcmH/NrfG